MHNFPRLSRSAVFLLCWLATALHGAVHQMALVSAVTAAMVHSTTVHSATARPHMLSQARCARLALDLRHIREQFRRGYSIRQQVQLEQKQDKLRLALQDQCQPVSNSDQPDRRDRQRVSSLKTPPHRSKPMQISVVSLAAPYRGKQQQAWLAFYQSPFYCYNVRATERIRQCVEQRQAAQRKFERQWQQQNLSDQ